MNDVIDRIDIIKQIGKGSFSNVYLCKMNDCNMELVIDNLQDDYFIIKEININALVKKYIANNVNERSTQKSSNFFNNQGTEQCVNPNITPYENESSKRLMNQFNRSTEEGYYYRRLKELIESEIEVLSVLDNKNIIKFFGTQRPNREIYCLSMEYCDKGDVHELLRNRNAKRNKYKGLEESIVLDFVYQTIIGLNYIHCRDIIHRDIKLQNILIKSEGNGVIYKLSDFGFACYDVKDHSSNEDLFCVDMDSVLKKKYFKLCGTPYYMAPEIIINMRLLENFTQYQKEENHKKEQEFVFYDKKIDMWSYGICIYELMFNELPFDNITNIKDLERFYKSKSCQENISKKYSGKCIDSTLKKILDMLLQVDPHKRASSEDVYKLINKKVKDKKLTAGLMNSEALDISGLCVSEDKLKQHIVFNPIDEKMLETVVLSESWEKINKSSSLIMKMSVEKGFLDWLLSKK